MNKEMTTFIEFNLNGGTRGKKGDKGDTGFSPTINLLKNGNQLTITITDIDGTRTETITVGDMYKTTYDTNNNGIVDNAEKVNNHTVDKDVPADAKFTDTIYDDSGINQEITQANERINQLGTSFQNQLEALDNSLSRVAKSGKYSDLSGTPTKLSDFSEDSTHRLVTDTEKTTWNNKYNKPSGGIPKTDLASAVQTSLGKADSALQSETDPVFSASAAASITSSNITNWNNKQNALTFDTTPTSGSTNPVTSGGIYTYVNTIVGDIETILTTLDVGNGV